MCLSNKVTHYSLLREKRIVNIFLIKYFRISRNFNLMWIKVIRSPYDQIRVSTMILIQENASILSFEFQQRLQKQFKLKILCIVYYESVSERERRLGGKSEIKWKIEWGRESEEFTSIYFEELPPHSSPVTVTSVFYSVYITVSVQCYLCTN